MFSNRYLLSLRERYQHSHRDPRVTSKLEPQEGQIVQIKGDHPNRESWRVGKITKLMKGKDGFSRTAKVKVDNSEYIRSISHLYPLEMDEQEAHALADKPRPSYNYIPSERVTREVHEETTGETSEIRSGEINTPEKENDHTIQDHNETMLEDQLLPEEITNENEVDLSSEEPRPKREAASARQWILSDATGRKAASSPVASVPRRRRINLVSHAQADCASSKDVLL
ncbi:uncharacterized protein [Maniola hyperantus]|uniref:uncharacterized protein n=1 Tax=Aphantopus hyperantus TaxID=2795564 RepID=UPI0037493195